MKQLVKTCAFADHGSFMLKYEFIPYNYIITIENEIITFNIDIEDNEAASTSLWSIEKYKSELNGRNIFVEHRMLYANNAETGEC